MKKTLTGLLCLLIFAACNRNGDDVTKAGSAGQEYFPLKQGSTFIYAVDSIVYDDNGPQQGIDTFNYQYKELVGETFTDAVGNHAVVINRFYRRSDTDEWVPARNFTAQLANDMAQRVEENIRFVKLVFPLRDRNTWNGNMFNNLDQQGYKLVNFKAPYLVNNAVAVSSIKVQQWDIDNFIEEIKKYEVYAENIGMVESLFDSLNTQDSGTRGFRYRLKLTSYTQ